ncbi:inner centromere protein, partial [Leucosporidium creatinivorum]
ELPDIDSEYSDSGDEGHDEKVKALPHWAQSPALAAALYRQQHVNPDDIFGPIPPLSMQEIFKTNTARFSKRTSSACWEGTDALTADDLARYNQAMGY